jgi:hypothetical protein
MESGGRQREERKERTGKRGEEREERKERRGKRGEERGESTSTPNSELIPLRYLAALKRIHTHLCKI